MMNAEIRNLDGSTKMSGFHFASDDKQKGSAADRSGWLVLPRKYLDFTSGSFIICIAC
jgi:hypothetical protein